MKPWRKYERFLMAGEWHVHTSYTDGRQSVHEACSKASELGIPLISFTEHVRKYLAYDYNRLLGDVEDARKEFPGLRILAGVEAKVLPDGGLDIDDDLLGQVDYPTFAFHSFPQDKELYFRRLKEAIQSPHVCAWDHPGLFERKSGILLDDDELAEVFRLMKGNDVLLEANGKYDLPERAWIHKALGMGVRIVRGTDIHGPDDFGNREKRWW
jgi:DNA polymerase (family 10)/putative hydrolase